MSCDKQKESDAGKQPKSKGKWIWPLPAYFQPRLLQECNMNDVFYFLDFFSINVMEIIPIWKSSIEKKCN